VLSGWPAGLLPPVCHARGAPLSGLDDNRENPGKPGTACGVVTVAPAVPARAFDSA